MRIPISGMTCQACASTIQDAISSLPGARDVQTNFALKQLNFDGVELDLVIKTLQSLGYDSPSTQSDSIFHVQEVEDLGLDETRKAKRQFLLALALGLPEFTMGMGLWPSFLPHWPPFIDAILAGVVVFIAGLQIHKRTIKQLKNGHLNMDTLVTLGSVAALIKAFALLLRGSSMPGFEAASTIIVFILLGRYLEARSRRATYSATAELFSIFQHPVIRLHDGREESISGLELKTGDHIKLRPGEISPVDGVIVDGKTQVSDQALTGEVIPKPVGPGSKIFSGTTVIESPITLLVKEAGQESFLGRLILELEKAQTQTVPVQRLADRVTSFFVPGVITFACLASLVQFLGGLVCLLAAKTNFVYVPAEIYHLHQLPVEMRFIDIFVIGVVSFLLCLLATLAPAFKGARLNPVEGLKYD